MNDAARPRRVWLAACAGALALVLLGLICTPFDDVLREDALEYLELAEQIRAGDWTARYRSPGWPALLAGTLDVLGVQGRAESMLVARGLSVLILALCVFPVAALARRAAGDRPALLAILAMATSPALIWLGGIAYSDPLFLLLVASCFATAAASGGRLGLLSVAATLASLAYWTRPNGLVILVALVAFALLARRRAGLPLLPVLALPVVFFAVSAPHLVARARGFGSPFDYGPVSKFLVDDYAQVWDPTAPSPSFAEYFSSHTPAQWFDRFVVHGVGKVGWYLVSELGVLWVALTAAGLWVWMRPARVERPRPDLLAPVIILAGLLAGLAPVFAILFDTRYITPMLPFAYVIGVTGFAVLVAGHRRAGRLAAVLALLLVAQVPVAVARDQLRLRDDPFELRPPHVRDAWAHWTVRNLPPPVVILEGGDLLQLAADEARASGGLPPEVAARPDYPYRIPGVAPDVSGTLDALERQGLIYVLVDSRNAACLPWLRSVATTPVPERLELVRSFEAPPGERWALADMRVYRILPRPGG